MPMINELWEEARFLQRWPLLGECNYENPQHLSPVLPSDTGDFSLTCGDQTHSSAGYAIHLANEGFILLGQPTTIIYAVYPALRDVLEVPFAITFKSVILASWLPSMYGKPEFPILSLHVTGDQHNLLCSMQCSI